MTEIVTIGDVGVVGDVIHIGDEAMFEALVTELRSRGINGFVGISRNPAETARRYGIDAVEPLFAPGTRTELAHRMSTVLAAARGQTSALSAADPAWDVIGAVSRSDAVAIAGGGNLSSLWPHHIYERATLGELARQFERPLVVTGQTLGPTLVGGDAELVAALLESAQLVGVRESASLELARNWGITGVEQNVDDASFVGTEVVSSGACVITLSTHLGGADRQQFVDRIVELIETIDLEPVFVPHFASLDPAVVMGDAVLHEVVRSRTGGRAVVPTTSQDAAAIARGAAVVVTSRYHPAVFAAAAGVPVIAIPVDDYTGVKLGGALRNAGQNGILPVPGLLAGDGPGLLARLGDSQSIDRGPFDAWWDRVATTLSAPRF